MKKKGFLNSMTKKNIFVFSEPISHIRSSPPYRWYTLDLSQTVERTKPKHSQAANLVFVFFKCKLLPLPVR